MAVCGNNHPSDNYTVRCQLCSAPIYGAEPVREWITALEADKEYVFSRDEVKRNAVEA